MDVWITYNKDYYFGCLLLLYYNLSIYRFLPIFIMGEAYIKPNIEPMGRSLNLHGPDERDSTYYFWSIFFKDTMTKNKYIIEI